MKAQKLDFKISGGYWKSDRERFGNQLLRKAKDDIRSRREATKKDIDSFSKDTASYLVNKATDTITSAVVDTPAGRRAYERAFGKNKKAQPGKWVLERGHLKRIR